MADRFEGWRFAELFALYWWPTRVFVDVRGKGFMERVQAMRENRRRARWLLVYARRWAVLAIALYGAGLAIEPPGAMSLLGACSIGCYLAAIVAGSLMLFLLQGYARTIAPERYD